MSRSCLPSPRSRIERKTGPLRIAYLPGESQPVTFSVHGAIAQHYKVDPAKTHGIARRDNRLRDCRDRRLNGGHFWRRAGSASHRCE